MKTGVGLGLGADRPALGHDLDDLDRPGAAQGVATDQRLDLGVARPADGEDQRPQVTRARRGCGSAGVVAQRRSMS